MKYTCGRCKKELEYTIKGYGGYTIAEMKDLCPKCWAECIKIRNRHNNELDVWWIYGGNG